METQTATIHARQAGDIARDSYAEEACARDGHLTAELDMTAEAVDRLGAVVAQLEDRLELVMNPASPLDSRAFVNAEAAEALAPHAARQRDARERLVNLTDRLSTILARLEV